MSMENNRVLAHDLCRELTVTELESVAGGLAKTGTSISGSGTSCHDTDDSTTGQSSDCK